MLYFIYFVYTKEITFLFEDLKASDVLPAIRSGADKIDVFNCKIAKGFNQKGLVELTVPNKDACQVDSIYVYNCILF